MLSKVKNTLRIGKRVYDAFIVADRASALGSTADHERPTKRTRTTAQSLHAYGVYTEEEMAMAMFRVIVQGGSYRMAAGDSRRTRNKFLNKDTIQRRVMQWVRDRNYRSLDDVPKDVRRDVTLDELRSRAKVRQGAPRMLGSKDETALAAVLYALSLDGRSLTWDVVQPIVVAAFKTFQNANGVDGVGDADAENARVNPTKGWLASFLQRHPYLVERKGKMLEDARLAGEAKLPAFLDRVCTVLGNEVLDVLIINMDESMCSNQSEHIKVIGATDAKAAHFCGAEAETPHVSILPAVTAAGHKLPTLIIEADAGKKERIPDVPTNDPRFMCGRYHFASTASGFITEKVWTAHILNVIIPAIDKLREDLLLTNKTAMIFVDGHAAHVSLEAIQAALNRNIIFCFFPSHCSHVVQALDRGIFKVFKQELSKKMLYSTSLGGKLNLGSRIDRIMDTWDSITEKVIVGAWKHTGLVPFDRERVLRKGARAKNMPTLVELCQLTASVLYGIRPNGDPQVGLDGAMLTRQVKDGIVHIQRQFIARDGQFVSEAVQFLPGDHVLRAVSDIKSHIYNKVEREKSARRANQPAIGGRMSSEGDFLEIVQKKRMEKAMKRMRKDALISKLRAHNRDSLTKDETGKVAKAHAIKARVLENVTFDEFGDIFGGAPADDVDENDAESEE
jgi:hypothetical protein